MQKLIHVEKRNSQLSGTGSDLLESRTLIHGSRSIPTISLTLHFHTTLCFESSLIIIIVLNLIKYVIQRFATVLLSSNIFAMDRHPLALVEMVLA